jgi:hypothetical protein
MFLDNMGISVFNSQKGTTNYTNKEFVALPFDEQQHILRGWIPKPLQLNFLQHIEDITNA